MVYVYVYECTTRCGALQFTGEQLNENNDVSTKLYARLLFDDQLNGITTWGNALICAHNNSDQTESWTLC